MTTTVERHGGLPVTIANVTVIRFGCPDDRLAPSSATRVSWLLERRADADRLDLDDAPPVGTIVAEAESHFG